MTTQNLRNEKEQFNFNWKEETMATSKKKKQDKSILGRNAIFTPEVINDIHIKSQLGRYRMRGMALMKKIPHWDDLTFLPGTLTRFVMRVIEKNVKQKL